MRGGYKVRKWNIALALVLVLLLAGCSPGVESSDGPAENQETTQAQTVEPVKLTYALIAASGSSSAEGAQDFIDKVSELSGGAITIEFFPDGVLGSESANQSDLIAGSLDMAGLASSLANVIKGCNLFELPYIITDRSQIDTLLEAGVFDDIKQEALDAGLVILGVNENGFRHITNNVKPIFLPEDLKDMKIRTPNNTLRMETFKYLGANPTPMSLGELYQGLSQGVVQGQENPLIQICGSRLYEVQKYLSLSYHIYSPGYMVMSKVTWDKLSEAQQNILLEAAEYEGKRSREKAVEQDEELLQVIRDAGVEVNTVDIEAFQKAMMPLWDEFADTAGAELIDKAKQALGYE
ncbi:hypothetical protein SDC9_73036 [bioreactor metagenome]|uniref:Solute-binding protein n=1 Tax=bioreactor metagenome TaxID=1076179 RepID=A0A644YD08_9ZZZZ